ncbi:hypothetical protein K7432_017073, partial [Basidiobolus ranarum]
MRFSASKLIFILSATQIVAGASVRRNYAPSFNDGKNYNGNTGDSNNDHGAGNGNGNGKDNDGNVDTPGGAPGTPAGGSSPSTDSPNTNPPGNNIPGGTGSGDKVPSAEECRIILAKVNSGLLDGVA